MASSPLYETDEVAVAFPVQGQRVAAVLHRPVGFAPPYPAVLICHGFTGNKMASFRKFVTLGRKLARLGVATFRFDYRGCGDSEGASQDTTMESELADARAALAWLFAGSEMDADRVGILGVSLGGVVAARLLAENESLRGACFWAAVSRPDLQFQVRSSPALEAALEAKGYAEVDGFAVGKQFLDQLRGMDPMRCASATRGRSILLLHGEKDASVPLASVWDYEKAYQAAGNRVTVHVVPGADHRYTRLAWQDEVLGVTADWFQSALIDPPPSGGVDPF